MRFRTSHKLPLFPHQRPSLCLYQSRRFFASFFAKKLSDSARVRATSNGGTADSGGSSYLVPGATVATLLMLGALHARRLYDDKKVEEARAKGIEYEFQPDVKATFLRLLPLRSISRFWGFLASVAKSIDVASLFPFPSDIFFIPWIDGRKFSQEVPVWMRPSLCRAWARAFHSNIEEAALPLEEYSSLREFFVRSLKEGSRPIDPDPKCLVSPVDGTILRCGELKGTGAMIEQVKGLSYSVYALLGSSAFVPMLAGGKTNEDEVEKGSPTKEEWKKSWWRVSLASPKIREDPVSACPMKGLFYCVIYLRPGDYHRIHSPANWNIVIRRHFSGHLFPLNERATRTIRNLYVENERVVLEGLWQEGFMALAAIGATNIGSIELYIEPELRTNRPKKKPLHSEPPEERFYEPEGVGIMCNKGDEMGGFNMGSTVVLIFQAPLSESPEDDGPSGFRFGIKQGDRIRVGQALGRWKDGPAC